MRSPIFYKLFSFYCAFSPLYLLQKCNPSNNIYIFFVFFLKYLFYVAYVNTPFSVHYEKIRNHLREIATNNTKTHSLARKYEHLCINQIQLRFLHFNQHSITLLGIHMRHWACKRGKYTFINVNIKVINTILKVNRDNRHTLKCKHYSLTFLWHCLKFNSIPGQPQDG